MSESRAAQEDLVWRFVDAASRGDAALVSSLLSNSPSLLNRTGPDGWTALMHAARNGDHGLARALLLRGCDRSPVNRSSQTAFDIAKFWGHTHICRLLLRPDPGLDPGPGLVSGPDSGPGPVSDLDLRTVVSPEQSRHEMFFSAEPLDRLSAKRPDQDWIRTKQRDPRTVYLLFHRLSPLSRGGPRAGPTRSDFAASGSRRCRTCWSARGQRSCSWAWTGPVTPLTPLTPLSPAPGSLWGQIWTRTNS
ncbi:hypothetical protein NL108_017173 [Boleophthalmus pectinirostris]|nr:hypothetical protein NL108_017173 [Boleophthalmus pectinirostris]